jgi:hypothetical protein
MLERVIFMVSVSSGFATAQGGLENLLAVGGVGGLKVDARADDLVDAVQRRRVERDVGGGELALELLHRPGADDRRGDGGVVDDERDGQLDERYAGVLGDLSELFDSVELALVLGQRHVKPGRRGSMSSGAGRGAGVGLGAAAAGQPVKETCCALSLAAESCAAP